MIAVDSSTLIAYFQAASGTDVEILIAHLEKDQVCLPPVVVTELLSNVVISPEEVDFIGGIPQLLLGQGYWERAGDARRRVRDAGRKAKIADALIAQSCIDHDVALITRDTDFRAFAEICGLKLA